MAALKKHVSVRMAKNIVAIQPFKEGVSTVPCSGCFALLLFPTGSSAIKCTACRHVTSGVKIPCTSCKKVLSLSLKVADAVCPHCGYRFKPTANFRIVNPGGQEIKQVQAIVEADKDKPRVIFDVLLRPAGNIGSRKTEATVKVDADRTLSSNFVGWSTKLDLVENMSFLVTNTDGEQIDVEKTPSQLGFHDRPWGKARPVVFCLAREGRKCVKATHKFLSHQFMTPTSCALCKKFIWGVYKQGKWCSACNLPVHHRCAEKVTTVCEAKLRESCGLSLEDFGMDDPGVDIPEGFPVDDEDLEDLGMLNRQTEEDHRDAWMRSFDKLSEWTDEGIASTWKRYDSDKNGYMDKSELRQFLADLLGAGGGKLSSSQMEKELEKALARMDTNGNGIIEWEEFWYFHQAQRASRFLEQFRGKHVTEDQVKELWEYYDSEESGELDTDEIRALLDDCVSLAGVEKAVSLAEDGCGFWTVGELISWERFSELFVPVITGKQEIFGD